MSTPEGAIEAQIRTWLSLKGIFWFKVKTVGTYDPAIRRFRSSGSHYRKGVSDLIGIYKRRFLAIEVKSAKGKLSPHQISFLKEVHAEGGIAIAARSIEDVSEGLRMAVGEG